MKQTPLVVTETDVIVPGTLSPQVRLVARARRGDRDAFALLIEPRLGRLLRTARVVLGNETDAREAVQESLIAAWLGLPGLRKVDRFDAWLNRTLVNRCRDAQRRTMRLREIDIDDAGLTIPDGADAQASRATLLAAFDRLPIDARHILALRYLHDLALGEIAIQLDIPIGTAKSRLWSARRALARALEAEA